MKKHLFVAATLLFAHALFAQSTKGITGKRDTSYTTFKAYKDVLKSNPNDDIYGFCTEMGQKPSSSLTYCLIKPLELNLGKNIS